MNTSSGENAFTILETIHRSGHFCVYKAKNYAKGTLVNIKTPEQRWKSDYSLCRQLRAEEETGLSLKHPSIRETLGLFEEDNTLYLVCEYLDGNPLENIIHFSSEKLDKETILNWILQILDALQYAHDQDILHLNVNTSSIIITTDNKVKLFGFGKDPDVWKTADADKTELHPVLFIAPEVFLGEKTGKHSDVYSVGILAYLLLCGQLPWSLDHRLTPSQQKNQTLQRPLINPDLLGKHIPHWLFSILNKALMLDPVKRFQSATAMAEAISSQSSLPYESCLNRSIGQGIPQNVKPEGKPGTREQIEISEPNQQLREQTSKPSGKDGLIKDVPLESRSETQSLTNQDESTRDESQAGSGKESPKHKVSARTSEHMGPEIQIQGPKRGKGGDISHMQRIFTIFAIITLLILAYIIVKYVVIKEEPAFAETDSLQTMAIDESEFFIANEPLELISAPGDTTVIGHIGPEAEDDEFPPREVFVPPFYISAREITREQWAMVYSDYVFLDQDKDLPITNVTFHEAVEYCNEKSRLDKLDPCYDLTSNGVVCDFSANGYRLPTEAEWEYAAKGGVRDNFTKYSGSETPENVAWFAANSNGEAHPVGQKQENTLGLYDMSGNVSEWTWNWYAPYSHNYSQLYSGPESGTDKVIRGGSWKDEARELRVTNRIPAKPYQQTDYIGFRVVRSR